MLPHVLPGALGCKDRRLREIARRLYTRPLTASERKEAEDWGLNPDELEPPPAEVWPSLATTVATFVKLSTQWLRAGMKGRKVGLNYEVLFRVMDRMALDDAAWLEMLDDIRTLEDEALTKMAEDSDG